MSIENLTREIRALAQRKNAIILAHNYQLGEVQDVADLTGDSLALSIQASKTKANIIVFCGVRFMAETAAIVCPDKKVILTAEDAGCGMADMLDAETLRQEKAKFSGIPVVTYVNSTAEVKAESDICCTSANAVQVVRSIKSREVLMTPDKNLAMWVQRHTEQKVHYWPGYCPIHNNLTVAEVKEAKAAHPNALLMAHPECRPEILDMADAVKSTSGMLSFASKSEATEFIVGTEIGLLHQLKKQNPEKEFWAVSPKMICTDMKKTSLKHVLQALKTEEPVITIPEEVRLKALRAVERMMAAPRD